MTATMTVTTTLRLKVKPESHNWLNKAAVEANTVWNWADETSEKAVRRFVGPPKWLSGYDLGYLTAGASKCFEHLSADCILRICHEYARKRFAAKKARLSWRRSGGSRRSLGWVPFKGAELKRKGNAVRICGKTFRVFESSRMDGLKLRDGCFAQDAVGDWWLCVPVSVEVTCEAAPLEIVGVDLGLKETATTSAGDRLAAGTYYRDMAAKIGQAQRRGHKKRARRLHRKAARQRRDALHKFSRKLVNTYQNIIVGDVSSTKLAKTRMAKSVLDSGWGMLRTMLQHKGQQAGRTVEVVNEAYTTRACSSCGQHTGPSGLRQLAVRAWQCSGCGTEHDRDVNAARNIALLGSRCRTSVSGNESRRRAPKRIEVAA
jgi:putative transposase